MTRARPLPFSSRDTRVGWEYRGARQGTTISLLGVAGSVGRYFGQSSTDGGTCFDLPTRSIQPPQRHRARNRGSRRWLVGSHRSHDGKDELVLGVTALPPGLARASRPIYAEVVVVLLVAAVGSCLVCWLLGRTRTPTPLRLLGMNSSASRRIPQSRSTSCPNRRSSTATSNGLPKGDRIRLGRHP